MSRQRIRGIAVAAMTALCLGCSASDAGITTAIKSDLAADDEVKAYQIDVDTKDKVVTLTGTVDTPRAKTRAAEIARLQKGVFQVIDNVTVTAAAPALISDAALTAGVKAKFSSDATMSGSKITVDTLDGVMTLSGEVRSQTQKDLAVRLARETMGVREVNDRMTVAIR
jgi:hyperosmotically inducible periplasmic protein